MNNPLPREDLPPQTFHFLDRRTGVCCPEMEQEVLGRQGKGRGLDEMSDTLVVILAAEALIWIILLTVVAEKNRENH